jgi:valyl-tRNA synthetase
MAKIDNLEVYMADKALPNGTITSVLEWCEVSIAAPDGFDFDKARTVIAKKLGEVTGHHEQHLKRLGNPDFLAKAAPEMREETQQRAQELESQRRLLSEQLRILGEAH